MSINKTVMHHLLTNKSIYLYIYIHIYKTYVSLCLNIVCICIYICEQIYVWVYVDICVNNVYILKGFYNNVKFNLLNIKLNLWSMVCLGATP